MAVSTVPCTAHCATCTHHPASPRVHLTPTVAVTGNLDFWKTMGLKFMVFGLSFPSCGRPQSGEFLGFILSGKVMRLVDGCCHHQQSIKGHWRASVNAGFTFAEYVGHGLCQDNKDNGHFAPCWYESHRWSYKIDIRGSCFDTKGIRIGCRGIVEYQCAVAVLVGY